MPRKYERRLRTNLKRRNKGHLFEVIIYKKIRIILYYNKNIITFRVSIFVIENIIFN